MKFHTFITLLSLLCGLVSPSLGDEFQSPAKDGYLPPHQAWKGPRDCRTDTWEPPHIVLTNIASADRPVWIANAGDGSKRLFVVQQSGTVVIVGKSTPFLDIRTNIVILTPINSAPANPQTKLVSIAFPPRYSTKGYFYVSYYTWDGTFKVSRFHVSTTDANVADPNSEEIIGSNYPLRCSSAGQLIFASDGTLFLNLAGPIVNTVDADLTSGKMLALLNEAGHPLPTHASTDWPFSQYFNAFDCSVRGGAFAVNSSDRMNGVYFYGDENDVIWGLKFDGTNWVKYDLASPMASVWLPTDPLPGTALPTNPNPGGGTTITSPRPTNGSPIIPIIPITPITINGTNLLGSLSLTPNAQATTQASITLTNKPLTESEALTTQSTNSTPQHPFTISAFGLDEEGRLYVADYGSAYWSQGGPPKYTPVENFSGGGIYLIQDDLMYFKVHHVIHGHQMTLEWQSAPDVQYSIQESEDLHKWFNVRPPMTGNGKVLSVPDLSLNPRIFYRVVAATPSKT